MESTDMTQFATGDPACAANWTRGRKIFIIFVGLVLVVNSTLNSSLPSGAADYIAAEFNISNQQRKTLLVSIFLIGYIFGPIVFAPLSEVYGRKWVMLIPFVFFTGFSIGCALSSNWAMLLVFRFIVGATAAASITVVNGIVADIYTSPLYRGRAIALKMVCTAFGPVLGPIISNALAPYSWRWTFWFTIIFSALSWPFLIALPETYAPKLLRNRLGTSIGASHANVYQTEIQLRLRCRDLLSSVLIRPVTLFSEPIISFSCTFLALEYGIYYLFFQAYPIIFDDFYKLNSTISALAFIPLGVGAILAGLFSLWYDWFFLRAQKRRAAWTTHEEYRRLPLACVGGPLCTISLFWLGWASQRSVHFIVPMAAGVPYGMGFELIFIGLLNYIADSYAAVTASAMASSTFSRSILGVLLPLAASPLYDTFGVHWAPSLLGFLSFPLALGPFLFLRFGKTLRKRSRMCNSVESRETILLQ